MTTTRAQAGGRKPVTKNALDNPGQTNADVAKLIADSVPDYPTPEYPPDDLVTLPGGLVRGGRTVNQVVVRELTGEDEETLARSSSSTPFHFMDTLLECGTVSIGEEPTAENKTLLKDLLIGDRDALILGIRKATYGEDIHLRDWSCPQCGLEADLTLQLEDIPVRELDDPSNDTMFDVKLRKGRKARVRLANGHDQASVLENSKYTQAERDTVLLSRCVLTLTQEDGSEQALAGFGMGIARGMSMPDRRAILREMTERQPGPQFDEIKYLHGACGSEVKLAVTISELFLDA